MEYKPFFTVSISAPARRAALTAFSSLRAAAVGAFLRMTTGSQSCANPDILIDSPVGLERNNNQFVEWMSSNVR
ncbi:hypothetical protein HanXRQr2_Chr10g0450441 [Helianthus annuus]|uniref:Uncharacterized protein n=1 Tax=Helianthus annuus TaxID=4232 RepID=A0A9K3HZM2_HELAN|nr:hypothetical protein HanXRQr2_Chr10g0450441 [Helianthus annuus]